MTDHPLEHDAVSDSGSAKPALMETDIGLEIANEMRALAAAMFGLRFQEEIVTEQGPRATAGTVPAPSQGLGDVAVPGATFADFDFDQDHGGGHNQAPQDDYAEADPADDDYADNHDDGSTPPTREPSRWATPDEPTIHNARTRAMLEEIAFLDE